MKILKLFLFALFFIGIGWGSSKYIYMQSIYGGSHENAQIRNLMKPPVERPSVNPVAQPDTEKLKSIVLPFYLSLDPKNPESATDVLEKTLATNYISYSQWGDKDKKITQWAFDYYRTAIPDLVIDIQEMLVTGNQVTVRSIVTGTPEWEFFGVKNDKKKSFKVDTIDIHTVENGQIVKSHHVEDWATAIQQLSAE